MMQRTSGSVAVVTGVTKYFGSFTALNNISLEIHGGECFGLLGPNGAGKSTLIRILYGASSRDAGRISVLGLDPQTESRRLKKRLGVVTQEDALDEAMTVEENMLLFGRFLGIPHDDAKKRIAGLLEFMSLGHKRDALIQTLSGGMRRRLVFVRALINEPELLILDEPTTGLDPAVRQLIWGKIRELRHKGTSIILTTHYMDEAEVLCDRLVIMDSGAVKVQGAPKELIRQYCPGFVMRPSSLEDVFLHVTGKELGHDA